MASFPTRRTPKAPLHPPYRAAPASPSYAYASHHHHVMESADSPSSSSSKKRNWTSGTSSLAALSRPYAAPLGEFYAGTQGSSYFEQQQHQHQHQVQQQHASSSRGAGGAYETLARAQEAAQAAQVRERQQSAITLASNDEDSRHGPPNKRRKGVAGAIVEGTLSTALYAGAAAITAYSLWSSWGRRPSADASVEPPPPPYPDEMPEAPLSPGSSSAASGSRHNVPRHVYVSQRRRRPAIPSHRSSHRTPQRARAGSVAPAAPSSDHGGLSDDAEHEDDDDDFARMNKRMAAMIAEGQAALSTQVEIEESDEASYASTPSRYGAVGQRRCFVQDSYAQPPSLRTMRTPSQIDFSFATHSNATSPFLGSGADGVQYDSSGEGTYAAPDTFTSSFVFGAGSSSASVAFGASLTPGGSGSVTPQASRFKHGTEVDTSSSVSTPQFHHTYPSHQSYNTDSPSEQAHRRPRWR